MRKANKKFSLIHQHRVALSLAGERKVQLLWLLGEPRVLSVAFAPEIYLIVESDRLTSDKLSIALSSPRARFTFLNRVLDETQNLPPPRRAPGNILT